MFSFFSSLILFQLVTECRVCWGFFHNMGVCVCLFLDRFLSVVFSLWFPPLCLYATLEFFTKGMGK